MSNQLIDSKIQWVGKIPTDWSTIKIKWLTSIKRGASPRPIDDPKFFDDNGQYAWVRIADVSKSGMYLNETPQKMSNIGSLLSVKREPGDIFISIAGTVGKPCITSIKCCIHDGFVYFPDFKGEVRYLYYIFDSGEPYKGLGKMGTQLNLNTETVGSIEIPNIPRSLQMKISDYLDVKTEKINKLIAIKENLIKLLEEKRQAMITEAVTKGLNPNVKMKDSGVEWIGEIPEHWISSLLKRFCVNITDGSHFSPEIQDEGYPYVTVKDIQDDRVNIAEALRISEQDFFELTKNGCKPLKGDILLSKDGTIGKVAIVDKEECVVLSSLAIIKPTELVNSQYLAYWFKSKVNFEQMNSFLAGAALRRLTIQTINKFKLVLPPVIEQLEIAKYLDCNLVEIIESLSLTKNQIQKLKEYRQSLIYEAVTGKIDVRDFEIEQ